MKAQHHRRGQLAPTLQMSPSCVTRASMLVASGFACLGEQDGSRFLEGAEGVGRGVGRVGSTLLPTVLGLTSSPWGTARGAAGAGGAGVSGQRRDG